MDSSLQKSPYRRVLLPTIKRIKVIKTDLINYASVIIALCIMLCYIYAIKNPFLLLFSMGLIFIRIKLKSNYNIILSKRSSQCLKDELIHVFSDQCSNILIFTGIVLSTLCSVSIGIIGLFSMFLISYKVKLNKEVRLEWKYNFPFTKTKILNLIMIFSFLQYLNLIDIIPNFSILGHTFTYFGICMGIFILWSQITVFENLKIRLEETKKIDWLNRQDAKKKKIASYECKFGNTEITAQEISDLLYADLKNIAEMVEDILQDNK